MKPNKVVRGYGPLDSLLAGIRCRIANKRIATHLREGRILDIGCGEFPLFLSRVTFQEKYGLDKGVNPDLAEDFAQQQIHLVQHDLAMDRTMPFEDNFFEVVTMLAVFEHIEPEHVPDILLEIYRVLKPGGGLVLTTPAPWADKLLRFLARIKLISAEEIEDHKAAYTHGDLRQCFSQAGFALEQMQFGFFELFLNLWACAKK